MILNNHTIVDSIHIFNNENYESKETINGTHIQIVQEKETNQFFYLIKKGEEFNSNTKYSFINHCEKSFELIHPSLINLSGFSIEKPYLYYKYSQQHYNINNIKLTDENVQKILVGLASVLSYLYSKGFYLSYFSIKSIIFDSKISPKLIDYINLADLNKVNEKDSNNIIFKYVELMKNILNKKKNEDPSISINENLSKLIERCEQRKNLPTFDDFINFFKTESYSSNSDVCRLASFVRYCQILNLSDKIIFDDLVSKKYSDYKDFDEIEQISYYFFNRKKINEIDDYFLLNSLPDYYIKSLTKFSQILLLQHSIMKCAYTENILLILPDWKNISDNKPFKIYTKLMKELKNLEKQKSEMIYYNPKTLDIQYKIDAIKIQAIYFLKKAAGVHSANSNVDAKCKIELAVQYIKGYMLPYNIKKALNILESISNVDKQTQTLLNQMKEKVKSKMKSMSIENITENISEDQKKIFEKAEKGDILSMLYIGFALYTGFNGFPVIHSLSLYYYRKAAKSSPNAMELLGFLYCYGIFFPQNFKRSTNCFKRAADKCSMKAQIIDCLYRKHKWRSYLLEFDVHFLYTSYLQSFSSMIPNDSLILPRINYFLEKNLYKNQLFLAELDVGEDFLDSNNSINCSKFLRIDSFETWDIKVKQSYSEKVLLCSERLENIKDVNKLLFIAKSYFNGDNGFPVNYTKATEFFKLAADNGNSEAQWILALLCYNSIGIKYNIEIIDHYFQESVKQNNVKGKLYYTIYLKKKKENPDLLEKLIKENCDVGDVESMYFYGMLLESDTTKKEQSIEYYKKAAGKGHFDSLVRLINILKNQLEKADKQNINQHKQPKPKEDQNKNQSNQPKIEEEEEERSENQINQPKSKKEDQKEVPKSEFDQHLNEYMLLSIGILNFSSLIDLIEYNDDKKNYEESNILIEVGLKIDHFSFGYYYINHLLYGKGMEPNIELAKKMSILLFNYSPSSKKKNYILSILQSLVMNNEHKKALGFLLRTKSQLNEDSRKGFQLFYESFDKKLARRYFIPVCFYYAPFVDCHNVLMKFYLREFNLFIFLSELSFLEKKCNPFAMAILGRIYKQGRYLMRNLKTATKYFVCSAKNKCPLGYYYIGKEFFYGRFLNQNYDKAKKYLSLSIEKNDVPKAGYYLFKISTILCNETLDDIEMLKIGVKFGHKRALYKYGHRLYTGKDKLIPQNKNDGIEYIKEAAYQNYKKAKKFCYLHGISYKKHKAAFELKSNSNDSESEIEDTSFYLVDLDESEKNSDLIQNEKENQSFDLFSLSNDDTIDLKYDEKCSNKSEGDQITIHLDELDKNDKAFSSIKSKRDKNDFNDSSRRVKKNINSTKQDEDKLTNLNQQEIDDSIISDQDLKSILDENESFSDFDNFWF